MYIAASHFRSLWQATCSCGSTLKARALPRGKAVSLMHAIVLAMIVLVLVVVVVVVVIIIVVVVVVVVVELMVIVDQPHAGDVALHPHLQMCASKGIERQGIVLRYALSSYALRPMPLLV